MYFGAVQIKGENEISLKEKLNLNPQKYLFYYSSVFFFNHNPGHQSFLNTCVLYNLHSRVYYFTVF